MEDIDQKINDFYIIVEIVTKLFFIEYNKKRADDSTLFLIYLISIIFYISYFS